MDCRVHNSQSLPDTSALSIEDMLFLSFRRCEKSRFSFRICGGLIMSLLNGSFRMGSLFFLESKSDILSFYGKRTLSESGNVSILSVSVSEFCAYFLIRFGARNLLRRYFRGISLSLLLCASL